MFQTLCACALNAGFIASDWVASRANGWTLGRRTAVIGGHVPSVPRPLNPARWLWGRGRRSKVTPCQLMRHCRPV